MEISAKETSMAKQRRRERAGSELERAWRERISAWATSGLTARAWCRDHGVSEPSFYAWRRKLRQGDGAASPDRGRETRSKARSCRGTPDASRTPAFVPVTVVGAPTDPPAASIEIVHGSGATVRVNATPDAELLTAVFAALDRASSC
jgi:transposase-like protein